MRATAPIIAASVKVAVAVVGSSCCCTHDTQAVELENPSKAVEPSSTATNPTVPGTGRRVARFASGDRATI